MCHKKGIVTNNVDTSFHGKSTQSPWCLTHLMMSADLREYSISGETSVCEDALADRK